MKLQTSIVALACLATVASAGLLGQWYGAARQTAGPSGPWYDAYSASALGLWPINEGTGTNILDVSPNARHGTSVNVGWSTNGGASFNGISSFIQLPVVPFPSTVTALTVSAWVRAISWTGGDKAIIGQYNGGPGLLLQSRSGHNNASVAVWLKDAAGGYYSTLQDYGSTGAWEHVAWVYNGSGTNDAAKTQIYVNSTSCAPLTVNSAMSASVSTSSWINLRIGNINGLSSRWWTGDIQRVMIHPTAYTAAQITNLYNVSRPP